MRILFITGTFEKGKDGVADYIAMLATECFKQGCTCAVLALNDLKLGMESFHETKEGYFVLRLASSVEESKKISLSKSFVTDFNPDWISLQLVAFAFHPRGFIFGLPHLLKSIVPANAKFHIMFHELWTGLASNHPFREKVYGTVQKWALQLLWNKCKPDLAHVSNNVYYSKLKQYGLPVRLLPLPSNIPVQGNPDFGWIYSELSMSREQREKSLVLLLFGSIHPGWDISAFLNKVQSYATPKRVLILSVGSQGYGSAVWTKMTEYQGPNLRLLKLGFRSDKEVSDLLHFSDLGVTTNALSLLGKSGTAMAMIEHGLPIVATRDELIFPFPLQKIENEYPQAFLWEQLDGRELRKKILSTESRQSKIAEKFLADLQNVAQQNGPDNIN